MPERSIKPDYSYLLERLANPQDFDSSTMPTGQDYLHSYAKGAFDAMASVAVLPITAVTEKEQRNRKRKWL